MNKLSSAPRIPCLLFGVCASAAICAPASADTIAVPAPYIEVNGGVGNFGTFSTTGATITLTSLPNPSITAITNGLGPSADLGTEGVIQYFVVVSGGQQGDLVPLIVDGSLGTSASSGGAGDVINASASIGLTFFNGNYGASESVFCGNVVRGEDCSNPTWSGTLTALAAQGYSNTIEIMASAGVEGSGTASAFADPYVYIDPSFLTTHPDYTLTLNVGNTPATAPEPSTWLLVSGCLLGLLIAKRKKLAF